MSSSTMCSQGAVLATAMAVSGTLILLAIRLHKFQFPLPAQQLLRPCISSSGGKTDKEKKNNNKNKKKRVRFAKDVVEPRGDGERFRRKQAAVDINGQTPGREPPSSSSSPPSSTANNNNKKKNKERGMPANRVALYNGILRDRLVQRLAYSC